MFKPIYPMPVNNNTLIYNMVCLYKLYTIIVWCILLGGAYASSFTLRNLEDLETCQMQ